MRPGRPLAIDGGRAVFVDSEGMGPDVVLVHGWGVHGGVWRPIAQELRAHFRVHRVDLPGHGWTPYEPEGFTLGGLVDQLAHTVPRRAHWVGWSLGGLVVLALAATYPERVDHLALVATTPCFARRPDWPHGVEPAQLESFAHELLSDPHGTLTRFLALEVRGSEGERDDLRRLRKELFARGEPTVRALRYGLRVLQDTDLRARLPTIGAPTTWMMGERDRLVPVAAARAAARAQPHARVEVLPKAGHAPFLAHPGPFSDRLGAALSSPID